MIQVFIQSTYSKNLKGLRHTITLKDAGLTAPMKPNKVTIKSNLQDKKVCTLKDRMLVDPYGIQS